MEEIKLKQTSKSGSNSKNLLNKKTELRVSLILMQDSETMTIYKEIKYGWEVSGKYFWMN